MLFRSLDQPALEKQLERQERDLRELVQINTDLNRRDAIRLQAARELRNTALSKLERERRRLRSLQDTYAQKVVDFAHLARIEVVAPLAQEVVATSDRNTALQVQIDDLRIREKEVISAFTKVKLDSPLKLHKTTQAALVLFPKLKLSPATQAKFSQAVAVTLNVLGYIRSVSSRIRMEESYYAQWVQHYQETNRQIGRAHV